MIHMMAAEAWSSPQMWRVAGALSVMRRMIEQSKPIVAGAILTQLQLDCDRLERRRDGLVHDAQRIVAGETPPQYRDALVQRILQFHRDVGELERRVESKCG